MRGLALVAMFLGGFPVATFVATLVLSDGAPLQSPFRGSSAGSGVSAAVHVTPDFSPKPTVQEAQAGIPTSIPVSAVQSWHPPDSFRLTRHRTDAAWDRLDRLAAGGNRDALMFRTLMQSADFTNLPLRSGP